MCGLLWRDLHDSPIAHPVRSYGAQSIRYNRNLCSPELDAPMKLGSLKEGGRDGTLIVVSRDLTRAVRAVPKCRRVSTPIH